jgi:origin recognition complex subunit 2
VIGQEERWRKLREQAVHHFFLSRVGKGNDNDESTNDDDDDDEDQIRWRPKTTKTGNQRTSRKSLKNRSFQNKNSSVTTADAGADLFFNKGAKKSRQSRRARLVIANQKAAQTKNALQDQNDQVPFERLSLEECAEKVHDFDLEEVDEYEAAYKKQFKEWRFLLSTNHSLMLYGYGSKFNLLNDFAQQELSEEGYAIVLNGFDPEISAESILKLLVNLFLNGNEPAPLSHPIPGYEEDDVSNSVQTQKDDKTGKTNRYGHTK